MAWGALLFAALQHWQVWAFPLVLVLLFGLCWRLKKSSCEDVSSSEEESSSSDMEQEEVEEEEDEEGPAVRVGSAFEGWSPHEDDAVYQLLVPLHPLLGYAFHLDLGTVEEMPARDSCICMEMERTRTRSGWWRTCCASSTTLRMR
ncbi:hypothetical protein QYF61_015474 [Mycteria americana]|uniref:Uncharacterized protein n=1 Tax=Mycteria americana TaxID=33587 RepID=A0AAN7S9L8_MYCAM|nr:hypothetical protein QYF61_015474 [Mycteria americana]